MKERSKNPATKMVAKERICVLFEQARLAFRDHPERSNRYVVLARRIAMRQRVRIDREFRRQYCQEVTRSLEQVYLQAINSAESSQESAHDR